MYIQRHWYFSIKTIVNDNKLYNLAVSCSVHAPAPNPLPAFIFAAVFASVVAGVVARDVADSRTYA